MKTETIEIPFEIIDKATKEAKKIQAQMDQISKSAKGARVSEDAFRQALDKVNKSQKESVASTKNQSFALTELKSGLDLAQQGFQKLKQAYDFAKEGANIEFAQERFDRLAASIGTTGDVLLGKMNEATKGTLSDMEAMAAATDLLSLGLAKTQDEAIRLATVQAGLGMDINQLVLTLTNQTTMRFDQLGVSVDGFKEKVKALEEQGYSATDAFQEAFLQQAEDQLERVGNAADSSAGAFKRLEAQLKNSMDEFKQGTGNALAPFVSDLADAMAETERYKDVLQQLNPELYNQLRATGRITPEMRELVEVHLNATDAYSGMKTVMQESIPVLDEVAGVTDEVTRANKEYLNDLGSLSDKMTDYQEKLRELTENEKLTIDERQAKINEYTVEYELNSKRRILAAAEEQLAADGFTEQEKQALEEKGIAWGIYTQEAVDQMRQEREEITRLVADINSIPSEKNVTISVQQIGGYDIGSAEYSHIAYAGRAAGGPVMSGNSYLVGERGPEIFTPQQSGNITPNNQIGGGIDENALARAIVTAMQRAQ